jgi:hypothetical protein
MRVGCDGFSVINMPEAQSKVVDQQPVARKPMQMPPVCTENRIRVDEVTESPKLAE